MTVFRVNALLNNPGWSCPVITLIKWRFEKIIIVLELIDVFHQHCVGGFVFSRQGGSQGERDLRERGSAKSRNHSCLGNAGRKGPPPPSAAFNKLFPLQLKQPQDTGMSQPRSLMQAVGVGPGSGPRSQQGLGTGPLATMPHVDRSGPSSCSDDRELDSCRAEVFQM